MLAALLKAVDAQVRAGKRAFARIRQCLLELELDELSRTAEWTDDVRHCRTGNGPAPRSSSTWPVSKRESLNGAIRSGAAPLATNDAHAAPEAGIALNPP